MWERIGYTLLCLAAPLAWGLIVVWVSNRVERAVLRHRPNASDSTEDQLPPLDYHI